MSDKTPAAETGAHIPAGHYCFKLGDWQVMALHEGVTSRERPENFVRNASEDEVESAFVRIGLPAGQLSLTFTTLAIDTGRNLILIDTGFGENGEATTGRSMANLAAAGYDASQVSAVLISHFHGDHITGLLRKDGTPAFPNADVHVPGPEWDFWMDDARMAAAPAAQQRTFILARKVFGALGARVKTFQWDEEVLDGIRSVRADGHTPGQSAFDIRSGGERMMAVADITNNPLIFARFPHWQAQFDMDGDRAVQTRRRILGEAAREKTLLYFYHAPFPALAYVAEREDGYEYFPALWR